MADFRTYVVFTFLIFLSSCSTFSRSCEQNLYRVHLGQSKSELIAAFGEPTHQTTEGSTEKWYYNVYSADNREIYPYTATFENGTLAKWDFDTTRSSEEAGHRIIRSPSGRMGVF